VRPPPLPPPLTPRQASPNVQPRRRFPNKVKVIKHMLREQVRVEEYPADVLGAEGRK
jgi:hypothetical protein